MHFACSRCAHRQAEDAACGQCGNDVVQDLRDSNARRVLHDAESRWQRRRQTRAISIGAAVGLILFFPGCAVGGAILGFALAFASGAAAVAVLDRMLGDRRRFPYLDEYEKAGPADKPQAQQM